MNRQTCTIRWGINLLATVVQTITCSFRSTLLWVIFKHCRCRFITRFDYCRCQIWCRRQCRVIRITRFDFCRYRIWCYRQCRLTRSLSYVLCPVYWIWCWRLCRRSMNGKYNQYDVSVHDYCCWYFVDPMYKYLQLHRHSSPKHRR